MDVVNTTKTYFANMYNYVIYYLINSYSFIIILILIVLGYYAVSSSSSSSSSFSSSSYLGSNNIEDIYASNSGESHTFLIIGVVILVLFILVNVLKYIFSVKLGDYVNGLITSLTATATPTPTAATTASAATAAATPTGDVVTPDDSYQPNLVPDISLSKQVFNIPGNFYTYDNAEALCTAYGSKLATYEQIEDAYNKGAEWCNYGWSADQLALFPTQKLTYDTLQKINGHENDCGRQGINGGYMVDTNTKFGVNCYGVKPSITQEESNLMQTPTAYPDNPIDVAFQKNVDLIKANLTKIMVSPFNKNIWSSI